jgi:hypothetical protein
MARAKQRTKPGASRRGPRQDSRRPAQSAAPADEEARGADHAAADLPPREVMTLLDPQLLTGALLPAPTPAQPTDAAQPASQPTADATQAAAQSATETTQVTQQYATDAAKLNTGQSYAPEVTSVAKS